MKGCLKTLGIVVLILVVGYVAYRMVFGSSEPEIEQRSTAINTPTATVSSSTSQSTPTKKATNPVDSSRKKLQEAKDSLEYAIAEYDKQSEVVGNEFEAGTQALFTFKSTVMEARDKYPEFDKVYSKWDAIQLEVFELQNKMDALEKSSNNYYQAATYLANTIKDDELRESALRKIRDSQNDYQAKLKKAKLSISQLEESKVIVDDTMKALEISFSLVVVEEKMDEIFSEMDALLSRVMSDLNDLSEESKKLLLSF